jgi:four helix bundle protein
LKRPEGNQQLSAAFRTFEDLEVYKKAREFRKSMYAVSRKLPTFEKYDLGSQIRRASVSLTNNIAEGHGKYHYLEQIKFQLQARGSLEELIDDLNVCEDEGYLLEDDIRTLKERAREVQRLISGYVRYLRDQKAGSSLLIRETPDENSVDDGFDELCKGLTI